MAFIIKDRVKEGTTSTGTGAVSLGGAAATFDPFQSYMTNGDTTYYAIVHTSSGVDEWEVGLGTWNTGNTLTRTTVLAGSNGTSAENFSAGTKDIFMTYPAAHAALAEDDVTFANISVTGTVDGRDVAADGTKLDTVEQNADVTDAVNVAAAGALMKSGGTMTGNLILNADPNAALGAATKQYVDTIASAGIHYHTPVRAEHPSNLNATYNNGSSGVGATLTNAGTNAALVIDNVSMVLNDRVLVANQTNQAQNGVYTVTTVGNGSTAWVLTRSTDTDTAGPSDPDSFGKGDAFFIKEGDTNAGHLDVLSTSGTIVFGTTNIVFSEVAETTVYSGGTGITLTGTTFSIGQDVATTANVTFNQVTANIIGNVTGNVTGGVTGNAGTATALQTARTIQLTGDVTGSASFDGSANTTITAVVQDDSHSHVISNVDGLQTALNGKTPTSRTITAGNGLTGGGNLTANRTLNVGAGTGVTVGADSISIGQAVGTTDDVTFGDVTADVFIAEGGSFVSGIDTNTNSAIVIEKGDQINVDDGNYVRNLLKQTTGGVIEVGQGATALITGINLKPGNTGQAQVNGVQIITDAGSGLTKSGDELSHSDTSSQASVNNSNGTVIQDITLDTYGHITGITSANLDGRYYTETEADSRFVNVTGDTMTGNLKVSIPDNGGTPAMTAELDLWGFEGRGAGISIRDQANSASGASNREWFIGTGYSQSGFNIGYSGTGTQTSYTAQNKFSLSTSGNAIFSGTAHVNTNQKVFADNYHPNADKWTTARTLSLSGDASGSVSWDGSANASLSVTVANDSHTHDGRYYTETEADSRFLRKNTSDVHTFNTSSGEALKFANNTSGGQIQIGFQQNDTDGMHHRGYIRSRKSSAGNAAGIIEIAPRQAGGSSGTAFTLEAGQHPKWGTDKVFHDGYHPNADKWTTARTLSLSGDASGSVSWDGSANATLSVAVANDSHTHSWNNITSKDATLVYKKGSINSNDWNTLIDGTEASWYAVNGHSGANRPTGAYTYGVALSLATSNQGKFQLYAPETASSGSDTNQGLWYRTGWNTAYRQWAQIWDSTNDGAGSGLDADTLDSYQLDDIVPTHSDSDFANGTLVTTDIPANSTNGASFVIEVTGKSYSESTPPFEWIGQGYLYNDTIIAHSATGTNAPSYYKVFNHSDNKLAFWWPRVSYWNSFSVHVRDANGSSKNRVQSISNSTEPSSSKKVQTNISKVWTAFNDGSGSGLDADLLDGVHGSNYVNTTGNQTIDGIKTFTGTNLTLDNPVNTWKYFRLKSGSTTKWDIATNENDLSGALQFRVAGTSSNRSYVTTGGYFKSDTQGTLWGSSNDGSGSGLDADLLDGVQGSSYLRSDANDTMTGSLTIDTGGSSSNALVIRGTTPTISFIDEGSEDDFYIHVNSNNFYVLRDKEGADGVGTGWETTHPLQLEGDTNIGYLFGSRMFTNNYHPNADKWTTARTLSLSGDASGSVSWDGSANATLSVTIADDSHDHTWANIDGGTANSVNGWGGLRHTTTSGYIDFGPANTSHAHIYTDRPDFYFNKELRVNNQRVFHDAYHPNADKWTTSRTLSLSGDASGSVSWDGSANATLSVTVNNDSHTHDGRYYTESESNARFTSIDHMRSTGNSYYTSTTTAALLSEVLGDGAFNSYFSTHKTGWSYAGNGNLTDAGRLTELAGTSWAWWTDNSGDGAQGYVTALAIAPNTGGSAGKVFIYNNQGSSYAPGWREVWTSASDGSGSGLDADKLDGVQGSSFLRSDTSDTFTTLTGTTLTVTNLTIGSSAKINFQNNDGISYNDGDGVGAFSFNADGSAANAKVKAGSFHGDGSALTGTGSTISGVAYGPWIQSGVRTNVAATPQNYIQAVADDNDWMFVSVNVGTYAISSTLDNPTTTAWQYRKAYRSFT